MVIKDLDKKTAIAVLDEVIKVINEKKPNIGEKDPFIWFNAYTDVREACHLLKSQVQDVQG